MKKLILILMSVPVILMAQNKSYTTYSCSNSIGDVTYKADEAVLKRFSLLERQIFTCEAIGVKVIVDINKASKAKLDFSFVHGDSGAEIKIKDMKYSACLSLLPIMEDWNNSIKSLLKSNTKNPIEIVLTIQAIKQSVIKNPIISRNQSDTNVRAWEFYRYRYAEDLMNNLGNYSYMLIAKERGAALLPYESGDKQGQPRKVSNETLSDSERMSRLIDKILPEKTLDQILLNKNCEETLDTYSIDFGEIDKIKEQEKKTAEENSPDNLEINEHLKKAKEYKVKGEYKKAEAEVKEALSINPAHQEANKLLGEIQNKLKEQDDARNKEEIKQHIVEANKYIDKGKYKDAKDELEAALNLDQNNVDAKELLEDVNKKLKEEENKKTLENLNGSYVGKISGINDEIAIVVVKGSATSIIINLPNYDDPSKTTPVLAEKIEENTFKYDNKVIKVEFDVLLNNPTIKSVTIDGVKSELSLIFRGQ